MTAESRCDLADAAFCDFFSLFCTILDNMEDSTRRLKEFRWASRKMN